MAEDNDISMDDVIVFRISERHCKVSPPREGEPKDLVSIKKFIMACLHRRNLDEDFEGEMVDWLNSYTLDEFKTAVEKVSQPPRRN